MGCIFFILHLLFQYSSAWFSDQDSRLLSTCCNY